MCTTFSCCDKNIRKQWKSKKVDVDGSLVYILIDFDDYEQGIIPQEILTEIRIAIDKEIKEMVSEEIEWQKEDDDDFNIKSYASVLCEGLNEYGKRIVHEVINQYTESK